MNKLEYNIDVYEVEDSKVIAKIDLNNTVDINEIKKCNIVEVDFIDD